MRPVRILPWTLLVAVFSRATVALAAPPHPFNPDTAEADARELIASHAYSFCTKPDDPLPTRARDLCPLAKRAPTCAPLAQLCDNAPEPPPELSPFWDRVLRTLAKVAPFAAWGVMTVLLGVVAYLVVRALRASRDERMPTVVLPRSEVSILFDGPAGVSNLGAEALLQRAREAHAQGDPKTALFTYLAAALRALDERGALRLSKERTNGEYVRACQELPSRQTLRELVREVDTVQFGGATTTDAAVSIAESRATHIVRGIAGTGSAVTLAAGMIAILLVGACGGRPGAHANPAGAELLVELLERQGADVATLPASLASLPLEGVIGPAVIVDLERVPLEASTRTHLMKWVNRGGTLVIAGPPALWPSELWAKALISKGATDSEVPGESGGVTVRVETRDAPPDEDDPPASRVREATLAHRAAMTWPSGELATRAKATYADGELYGALRTYGDGRVLGLASADLLSNLGLAVPGNAAALIALLGVLDQQQFAVARSEQGITPPSNPFAGLLRIGLGTALAHAALFIPILFLAYGARQAAPRVEPPPGRRAFAEHVRAVGGLYARQRVAKHALAAYVRHVDDRVRAAMGRGADPSQYLATRANVDEVFARSLYARALEAQGSGPPRGDELTTLQRLAAIVTKTNRD